MWITSGLPNHSLRIATSPGIRAINSAAQSDYGVNFLEGRSGPH
jgi:hypothetical protein